MDREGSIKVHLTELEGFQKWGEKVIEWLKEWGLVTKENIENKLNGGVVYG